MGRPWCSREPFLEKELTHKLTIVLRTKNITTIQCQTPLTKTSFSYAVLSAAQTAQFSQRPVLAAVEKLGSAASTLNSAVSQELLAFHVAVADQSARTMVAHFAMLKFTAVAQFALQLYLAMRKSQ